LYFILKLGYTFLGNQSVAENAALNTRFSESSLFEFFVDVHLLASADFLVCTLSSNVCRLVHEMRQQLFDDASDRTRSVDSIWFYSLADDHRQVFVNFFFVVSTAPQVKTSPKFFYYKSFFCVTLYILQ
jgi:hypothetical protein